MDAANMLKPALARGELRCIGATTLDEYRKYVEKDAALERRFQPVLVEEPSVEDTIAILRGLKERYEVHHGVRIQDAALVAAAALSDRYITDRFLPDKAIDLIDEAAAAAHRDRLHARRDRRARAAHDAARDRARGAREGDGQGLDGAPRRLETELAELEEQRRPRRRTGSSRRTPSTRSAPSRSRSTSQREAETAERDGDLERAAELSYGELPSSSSSSRPPRHDSRAPERAAMLTEEVDEEDIAEVVAAGPASRSPLLEGEREAAPHGGRLAQRVVGQDEAVARRRRRRAPRAGRAPGPEPSHRLLPLPRAHRRRQDRAGQGPGRVPLRRRAGHGPHRHVRVHGEALGVATHRRASRIRRLRRGRPAHRSRPAPSLFGHPARRNREGPPRRVQRAAAAPRRRAADRRPGPHRRLLELGAHHDIQSRIRDDHAGPPRRERGDPSGSWRSSGATSGPSS